MATPPKSTQKITPRKKPALAAVKTPTENTTSKDFFLEILGWMVILLAALSFVSCLAQFAQGDKNFLGPFMGTWWSSHLIFYFGKLPALLAFIWVFLCGLRILQIPKITPNNRAIIVFGLLILHLFTLLSLKELDPSNLSELNARNSGGALGAFLASFILEPILGKSVWGGLFLCLSSLFFLIIWGFRVRPSELITRFVLWIDEIKAELTEQKFARRLNKDRSSHYDSPAQKLIQKKQEQQENRAQTSTQEVIVKSPTPLPTTQVNAIHETPVNSQNALQAYEQQLAEMHRKLNLTNDPSEEKKIRDQIAGIQHFIELRKWEDRDRPMVNGLVESSVSAKPEEVQNVANKDSDSNAHQIAAPENPKKRENIQKPIVKPDAEWQPTPQTQRPMHERKTIRMDKEMFEKAGLKPLVTGENGEKNYRIPKPSEIFGEVPEQLQSFAQADLDSMSSHLEAQLANFGVKGMVTAITTGPVITRFEVDLAPGVKVAKISGLSDDLALAMKAKSIRILAPIPGKAAIGIEVPNPSAHVVYCRSIVESIEFTPDPDKILIALGKNIGGSPYIMDLARAPHLLIAGQTGSGKSVCINTIMASILFSKTPHELRMILVDPKVVELKPYEKIPHLLHPVITDPAIAVQALQWACIEMDRRYNVLALAGVRNLNGYNAKFDKGLLEDKVPPEENMRMPFLIIMIDELADLMMVAGKEVEVSIARIAQKARAVGIHLILATQRPSTNVITGTIKANLPTRIAFKVASQIDARTILDKMGAERLLGRGDMLFKPIEEPEPIRVHGAFLTDEEVEVLAAACSEQGIEVDQLTSFEVDPFAGSDDDEDGPIQRNSGPRDSLFLEIAEYAIEVGSCSTSSIQRRFQIGFARAGRIVDQLEQAGIVGKGKGSKPRDVLLQDVSELKSWLSPRAYDDE